MNSPLERFAGPGQPLAPAPAPPIVNHLTAGTNAGPVRASDLRDADASQVLKRPVVELRQTRRVSVLTRRDEDGHPLPGPCQKDAVRVRR